MDLGIIKAAIDMVNHISQLCNSVIEAGDPEKLAKNVNELNHGIDDTFSEMRRIIKDDESLNVDEKLERLERIAELEAKSKEKAGEMIKENRENVANVALEVFKGFLTCGLSFTPMIIKGFKDALGDDAEIQAIQADVVAVEKDEETKQDSDGEDPLSDEKTEENDIDE